MKSETYLDYWEIEVENSLNELFDNFQEFVSGDNIVNMYRPTLYKYLKNSKLRLWNKEIYDYTCKKIVELNSQMGKEKFQEILIKNLDYYISALKNLEIEEMQYLSMDRYNGSDSNKLLLFGRNIYNNLTNGTFAKILEFFLAFHSELDGRDWNKEQNLSFLANKVEKLSSKNYKYNFLTGLSDKDIRNALSHNGVEIVGYSAIFKYKVGMKNCEKKLSIYEFNTELKKLFTGLSAVLLAITQYLCVNDVCFDKLYFSSNTSNHTKKNSIQQELSGFTVECIAFDYVDVLADENKKQYNFEFNHLNLDERQRRFFAIYTAEKVLKILGISSRDSIMISYKSSKTLTSFIRFSAENIIQFSKGILSAEDLINRTRLEEGEFLFPINDETRDEIADEYRYYEDIENMDFWLTDINDISLQDKKRITSKIYLKKAMSKNEIISTIKIAVKLLKEIETFGSPLMKVKHGKMSADIIYFIVYKNILKDGENRSLFPDNKNFIAQVQYDNEKKFPITNNLVDGQLHRYFINDIRIDWNPNIK